MQHHELDLMNLTHCDLKIKHIYPHCIFINEHEIIGPSHTASTKYYHIQCYVKTPFYSATTTYFIVTLYS